MRIINLVNRRILTTDLLILKFHQKISGLLKYPPPILFHTRWGIHTFFLKEPIDVIIVKRVGDFSLRSKNTFRTKGEKLEVVKIFENIKPFRLAFWNPKYDIVIELQAGTIHQSKTKVGDQLEIGT